MLLESPVPSIPYKEILLGLVRLTVLLVTLEAGNMKREGEGMAACEGKAQTQKDSDV